MRRSGLWRRFCSLVWVAATLVVFGCGSSSSSGGNSSGLVQLINGVIDSPNLTVEISNSDDDVVEAVSSFGFQQASTLVSLARGTYTIEVYFEDPATGFEERLLSSEIDVRRNTIYTGLLNGTFADSQLSWFEKDESDVTDTEEEIELQVINLSSDTVAVYLGDTSAGLRAESLVATVAPGNVTDPSTADYDDDADYQLRLTPDSSSDIFYDSGIISVSESSRNTIVINDNVGPDPNSRAVFIVRDSSSITLVNDLAQSGFRMVNSVADVADVGATVEVAATGNELFDGILPLDEVSDLTVVESDFVDVEARAPSTSASSLTATVSLSPDTAYSIVIAGSSLEDDVSIRANEIDVRSVANSINIHFINALRETDDEDISEVDFYALPLGDSLSDTAPSATGINYLQGRSFTVGATAYDLVVTTAGTLSILAGPSRIFPVGGERMIAVATEAAGGGRPFRVELAVEGE